MITSETNYFKHYEEKFYQDQISDRKKKKMMYGLQTRVTKIINVKEVKKLKSNEDEKKLSEYNNLKQLIKFFLRKDFPYISFIFGGFNEIHNYAHKYKIPLLGHENCRICKESGNLTDQSKKKGLLDKIYNWVTMRKSKIIL